MTIQEKKDRIRKHCLHRSGCSNCPLFRNVHNVCYGTNDESIINEHYEILFGTEEAATTIDESVTTIDESGVIPLEAMIMEDADTIIKIKSSRKIDNITIYFKED